MTVRLSYARKITADIPPELPHKSVVVDVDGQVYQRWGKIDGGPTWGSASGVASRTWRNILSFGPVTLVWQPGWRLAEDTLPQCRWCGHDADAHGSASANTFRFGCYGPGDTGCSAGCVDYSRKP